MLSSETSSAGARQPQKSPKISECDAISSFLCFSSPVNYCKYYTYIILIDGGPQNHQATNPHSPPQNVLKLAKTQPWVQRQGAQTPSFHTSQTASTKICQVAGPDSSRDAQCFSLSPALKFRSVNRFCSGGR
jgi:hypothetical protein